ncbi:MAG: US12 family protein [Kofleriaceae bacterium]|nr:US12 family protein [Kofleriaceae bacterium]MCB9572471.1 US12 family protein [Kofleriaceae bacterium]
MSSSAPFGGGAIAAAAASASGRPGLSPDATAGVSERVRFIRLTYLHLFGAILLFAGLEWLLMKNAFVIEHVSVPILRFALGDRYNWLVVLALYMAVGYVADYWARHATSRAMQYAGLILYVIAEAVIFLPLLVLAEMQAADYLRATGKEAHIIRDAAFLTLAIFGALTASVLITKKDFSFMRGALAIASGAALMLIVISIIAGFNLGILFSVAMVLLAAGYVLYYTSQVLAHYNPQQYVAAALALFSAVALMFWYIIRILMKLRE